MSGKLKKFLKKIKLNRKSQNLLRSKTIDFDKFDQTIGLESYKNLNDLDVITSNLNTEKKIVGSSRSVSDLSHIENVPAVNNCYQFKKHTSNQDIRDPLTVNDDKTLYDTLPTANTIRIEPDMDTSTGTKSSESFISKFSSDTCSVDTDMNKEINFNQLIKHKSSEDVRDSITPSVRTIDVEEILYDTLSNFSYQESKRERGDFNNNDNFDPLAHPDRYSEDQQEEIINLSVESESEHSIQNDSLTQVSKNIEQADDEISTISVSELCESIKLISAFGSLPDLPARHVHQTTQTPKTPGNTKQICQFCGQVCKNKSGLSSHQRLNKLCKVKQMTPVIRLLKNI